MASTNRKSEKVSRKKMIEDKIFLDTGHSDVIAGKIAREVTVTHELSLLWKPSASLHFSEQVGTRK